MVFEKRGTQRQLLMMLGFCKDATDKKKAFGAYLTDLSKAFNGLCHVFTKLHAYCFDISSLNSLQDYLSKRKQRIKVDTFLVPGKIFHLKYHNKLYLGYSFVQYFHAYTCSWHWRQSSLLAMQMIVLLLRPQIISNV